MKLSFNPPVASSTDAMQLVIKHVRDNKCIESIVNDIDSDYDMGFITEYERDNRIVDAFINQLPDTGEGLVINSQQG